VVSKKPGTALPTISVTSTVSTDTVKAETASASANKGATGPGAIKEVVQITFGGSAGNGTASSSAIDVGDNLVVSINGVDYVGAVSAASGNGTATNVAASAATLINAAMGADVAVASGTVVTVTAPVAGVALPYITASSSNSDMTDVYTVAVQNQAANAAVTSAGAVAAPTGVTTYAATATGVANVSASATAKLTAKGTTVQTSGGLDVTATGTKSVGVSAAKGAVVVSTSNASTGEVLSNPGTGATATYGSGIYVSGGTTVNVTQTGATITSGAKSDTRANAIQVGVNPTAAKDASQSGTFTGAVKSPSGNDFFNAVGGIANSPTGDVTITTATTPYTTAAGKTAVAYGTGTTSVYTNGGSTVSITGTGTTTVTDVNTTFVASSATDTTGAVAGASKLSTVNLTGLSGTATIKSDAISTVSVKDGNTAAVVNVNNSGTTGVNTGAFNLNVGNSAVTVTNATATSVNVGSTAATTEQTIDGSAPVTNSSTLTLNAVKATSLNVTNANSLTLATGTGGLAKVATITASGAGNLTANVTNATNYAKLVTVDASAKTGKVALTIAATPADNGQVIKTGSGDDTVTLTGAIGSTNATLGGLVTTTVDLGAGNDKLVKDGGSVTTGAGIDAGAGTDTLDVTLVTIGNSAIFKNFERLNLKGATTATAFDATLLTNSSIDGIALGGDLSAANATFSVTNLAGTAVNATVTAGTDAVVTATLATSTGTSDALNLNFATTKTLSSGTPAINTVTTYTVKGITSTGIETVNVSSAGSITNAVDFTNQSLISNVLTTYTDTSNKTSSIVVTGAKEFTLGKFTVSRDDATELTVNGVDFTSGADGVYQNSTLDAANTATADVQAGLTLIDASATTGGVNIWAGVSDGLAGSGASEVFQIYDGLTIKGGSGSDMIRNSAETGVTTGGDGKDWLIVDGYMGSADGGAGDDTLVVSGEGIRATLTGGAGKDTFNLSGATMAASTVTLGSTSTLKFNTIADFEVGDVLQFDADGVANSAAIVDGRTAVAAATDNSLFGAINAALRESTVTQDVAVWFTYGGNTYIAYEDGTQGFAYGDNVVKLTGIHILTASAVTTPTTGLFGEA
jgi:S-layer protein